MIKPARVLIMDDEEQWREELADTLKLDGYFVDCVSTVTQALEKLDETLYHLLVLDIGIVHTDSSNLDGMHLLGELGKRGLIDAIKVIVFSANDTKERIRIAFKDYKVTDLLSRNAFSNQEFLESVRRVFSK